MDDRNPPPLNSRNEWAAPDDLRYGLCAGPLPNATQLTSYFIKGSFPDPSEAPPRIPRLAPAKLPPRIAKLPGAGIEIRPGAFDVNAPGFEGLHFVQVITMSNRTECSIQRKSMGDPVERSGR